MLRQAGTRLLAPIKQIRPNVSQLSQRPIQRFSTAAPQDQILNELKNGQQKTSEKLSELDTKLEYVKKQVDYTGMGISITGGLIVGQMVGGLVGTLMFHH